MSAPQRRRRRRSDRTPTHEEGGMERWLLTYSDMITLLMALFIIMWAVSSVNISKYSELRKSLAAAFHGSIQDSGASILNSGKDPLEAQGMQVPNVVDKAPTTAQTLKEQIAAELQYQAAKRELESLESLQRQIEAYARAHGFANQIATRIDERGLVIHLLTDKLLFDTGRAVVKTRSLPLLTTISTLLARADIPNDVRVEGNTDDVPISTAQFGSNWELSTARATAVLEVLLGDGVPAARLSAAGYADQRPLASNATRVGRAKNRRVDIVIVRRIVSATGGS